MNSLNEFFEALEKRATLVEADDSGKQMTAKEYTEKNSGDWMYVPEKTYFNGLMKPIVREISENKWEIAFLAPYKESGDEKEKAKQKSMMAHKEIEMMQKMIMSEEVEGSKKNLDQWVVKSTLQMSFEDALERCVDIVEGNKGSALKGTNFQK